MSSAIPLDAFHIYTYTTGVWYATRAASRIYDPRMVYSWFSNERLDQDPSFIELYNLRTDGLQLALMAAFIVLLPSIASGHITLFSSRHLSGSSQTATIARYALIASLLQHAGTAMFAYGQWADVRTATGAMLLGWAFSGFLVALGVAAVYGVGEGAKIGGNGGSVVSTRKAGSLRSGKKLR